MSRSTISERLFSRALEDGSCLRWTGAHTQKGYGQIAVDGRRVAVHRLAYEACNGPIPDGLEIDHVWDRGCRFRDCVNPAHLEAVTHAENIRRQIAKITACPKGHPYTEQNTKWSTSGRGIRSRKCRTCYNELRRKTRARNALKGLA